MADISNNPFVDHTAATAARYPAIDTVGSPPPQSQYTGWGQPQQASYGQPPQPLQQQFPQQQQQYGYPQQQQYHQQTGFQQQPGQSGFISQPQQQFAQPTGYNPGYGQQTQQPQYTGFPSQQQQYGYVQAQPTGYGSGFQPQQPQPYGGNLALAQFDPYANVGQSLGGQQPQPGTPGFPSPQTTGGGGGGGGPPGQQHPRQYIHSHKSELESWDPVSWRQCLSAFDALQEAWKQRKMTIEARIKVYGSAPGAAGGFFGAQQQGYGYGGYGGYNPQVQEIERLNGMLKEADSYVDTIAAAKFQMSEVQGSYRHSSDAASKRRVREATNAALQGLPDWPSPNF